MEKNVQKNGLRSWIVISAIVLLFLSFYKLNPNKDAVTRLTEVAFRSELSKGMIIAPVVRVVDYDTGSTYLTGDYRTGGADETRSGGKAPEKSRYIVNLVPGENEDLMKFLASRSVPVKVEEKRAMLSPLMINIIFMVGIGMFFFWMFSKRGSAGGLFDIGKSRAKILNGCENKCKTTFADIAGIDEAKEEVQEIIEFLKTPDDFRKLGGRIPKGILLVGPPGTGKTLLAKAIAGEAKVPFFAISGSDFEDMFVGVGASRMRDMFAEAKKRSPCIVFIDEIDSVGQKRNAGGSLSGHHSSDQTLNTLLVEMDGVDSNEGVVVIAATNRPDTLDSALLRPGRFDRQVFVDLPTLKGRIDILELHGRKIVFAPDADLSRIARGTPGFSGADLANLLNEAALLATRKGLDGVDMKTLEEARDKVIWGRERKSAGYSAKDRETTAWHEAGHAVLQLLVKNADPLHKVTVIPRGRALGATMSLPERDILGRSKSYFLDVMVVCCGGRVAEKLFTGDISTGAAQDIAQATEIARGMVCTYAMSDRFGFQSFSERNRFYEAAVPPAFSAETSREIDAEVTKLVSDAYRKAEELISENRDKLELLAKTLLERETMDGREVEELLGIFRPKDGSPGEDVEKTPPDAAEAQETAQENTEMRNSGSEE